MLIAFLIVVTVCAVAPAVLFATNVRAFRPPPPTQPEDDALADIGVIIPARNEQRNVEWVVRSVLTNGRAVREIIVVNDGSTDDTAAIVRGMTRIDPRVRLLTSAPLPRGWNGKQHACWQGAEAATAARLLFLDADVRLEPQCLARMTAFQRSCGAALVSGFPRLVCIGPLEKLLLPQIHFVLLSFLPFAGMRAAAKPGFAAGCGQFLMCDRASYVACGGHAAPALRLTMHDGLKLPRLFREHGLMTDLADITTLASVRMYRTHREVWQGLGKNATEGMAAPARIVPFTLLLLLGQVVPAMLMVAALFVLAIVKAQGVEADLAKHRDFGVLIAVAAIALLASFVPAFAIARRYRQPYAAAWFHPQAVLLLLALQWWALVRERIGRPVGWRGRTYAGPRS